jgi:hypothetical protein
LDITDPSVGQNFGSDFVTSDNRLVVRVDGSSKIYVIENVDTKTNKTYRSCSDDGGIFQSCNDGFLLGEVGAQNITLKKNEFCISNAEPESFEDLDGDVDNFIFL